MRSLCQSLRGSSGSPADTGSWPEAGFYCTLSPLLYLRPMLKKSSVPGIAHAAKVGREGGFYLGVHGEAAGGLRRDNARLPPLVSGTGTVRVSTPGTGITKDTEFFS